MIELSFVKSDVGTLGVEIENQKTLSPTMGKRKTTVAVLVKCTIDICIVALLMFPIVGFGVWYCCSFSLAR